MITEKNLFKLLDYENLKNEILLKKIADILNLQFYFDETTKIHTLAGNNFVIDFQEDFKLVFVDERYYNNFKYVEHYLNQAYSSGDKLSFYNFLRYFTLHDKPRDTKKSIIPSIMHSTVCDCIRTYNYCRVSSFDAIVQNYTNTNIVYNIFTHREEYHFYEPFFITFSKSFISERVKDGSKEIVLDDLINLFQDGLNLFTLFEACTFNKTIYKFFLSFSPNFYYSGMINNSKITIRNNWRVFVDEKYKKKKSFLFKKGFVIKKCIELNMS